MYPICAAAPKKRPLAAAALRIDARIELSAVVVGALAAKAAAAATTPRRVMAPVNPVLRPTRLPGATLEASGTSA